MQHKITLNHTRLWSHPQVWLLWGGGGANEVLCFLGVNFAQSRLRSLETASDGISRERPGRVPIRSVFKHTPVANCVKYLQLRLCYSM